VSRLQDCVEDYAEISKSAQIAPSAVVMVTISRPGATVHGTADGFDAIPRLDPPAIALFFVPSHGRHSRGIPVAQAAPVSRSHRQ
jgi:hypothetical protein